MTPWFLTGEAHLQDATVGSDGVGVAGDCDIYNDADVLDQKSTSTNELPL